jgi:hypothetical protein
MRDSVNRVQPMPNAAAKRMRRYRQRRREGLRCLTVQLRETEIGHAGSKLVTRVDIPNPSICEYRKEKQTDLSRRFVCMIDDLVYMIETL